MTDSRSSKKFGRRTFFKTCLSTATAVAANPSLLARADGDATPKPYGNTLLTDIHGDPLTSGSFDTNSCYIFHYPYVTTPCFLIRLDQNVTNGEELSTSEQHRYQWPGGVGPDNRIVAFSAICAHKLSYPTRTASFINFRPEEVTYINHKDQPETSRQLIYCCSESSVYDPARGAMVMGGPAPQPLTAIILRHDPNTDHYFATATLGGEMFNQFFDNFEFRIALENKDQDIRRRVDGDSVAYPADMYSSHRVQC